jgi:hypothetical protein
VNDVESMFPITWYLRHRYEPETGKKIIRDLHITESCQVLNLKSSFLHGDAWEETTGSTRGCGNEMTVTITDEEEGYQSIFDGLNLFAS